ncbi:glycoside hydrolase family 2 TIM barrel-domain containing protein [Cellulomonas sp. P22]|uniref:glycoside hydrolase family 2 TIM barrel-domain containing protein n=1 Tax=Cellulomonas sp. P22 TaxID=3373189 RepID=UPI00378E9478
MNRERLACDVRDPEVVGYGRLPQRGERAAADTISRIGLRGTWAFRWAPTWDEARLDEGALAEPDGSWGAMPVPGVWELHGKGTPYYLAFRFPPALGVRGRRLGTIDPRDTPTGVYRRQVRIPDDWAGQRVTLRFEGVKSAFHLLVGGEVVGYSEGSMTGATFDLTDRAVPGEEITVVVVVHRYSTGTFLEDQDMWFLSGITRDVWLEAEPAHGPWDVAVTGDYDADSGLGALRVEVEGGRGTCRVELDGTVVADGPLGDGTTVLEASARVVRPWSAEAPHLHDVTVTTTDGTDVDVRHLRVGFRRVEIVGEELRVNGRAVVLHGVNRHDFHPVGIWDVPSDVRVQDIALMKRANVNALRLSHYPNPDEVYRLCDELGLYVLDEAEVESHGVRRRGIPGDRAAWQPSVVARVEAMVRRSRSHASVIMWSLGNEAGDGEAFRTAKRAVRALDPTRPVHYEGDTSLETSEVFSLMYPTPQLERAIGEGRDVRVGLWQNVLNALAADTKPFRAEQYTGMPVIACEYGHAMENSFGNVAAHVENFHRYPRWAGGFVWDWVDQTIDVPLPDGRVRRAYGGAFGERPTDRWFCANGVVAADRTPNPAYAELAKVYQHVVIARTSTGVRLLNRHTFDDLSGLELRWRVERDGELVGSGEVADVVTAPGTEREVPLPTVETAQPGLWTLTVELRRREGTPWAEPGHVAAWEQIELARTVPAADDGAGWEVLRAGHLVHLLREDRAVSVDVRRGAVTSLRVGGQELLLTPLTLNLWRAPTDNDRGLSNFAPALDAVAGWRAWRRATRRARVHRVHESAGGVEIEWRVRGVHARLGVAGAGQGIRLDLTVRSSRHDLVRAGLIGTLDPRFDHVEWLGRGPGENYRDRRSGSAIGRWTAAVPQLAHAYPHPQENGNRGDLERIELRGEGVTLSVRRIGGDPFEASVRPYPQDVLVAARYADELPTSGPATMSLDVAHRGVGGDKPGELLLQPEGRLPRGTRFHTAWLVEGKVS